MSTHARIYLKEKHAVRSVYVHYDGYLGYTGQILLDNYQSKDKVNALIDLGDLSIIGRRLAPLPQESHSFAHPVPGVVIAYGRDRGETNVNAASESSLKWSKYFEEYNYYFENNKWYVVTPPLAPGMDLKLKPLTQSLIDDNTNADASW